MNIVNQQWQPPLPYEIVEATEHHGPYICNSYGTTVCDFYFMTDPSAFSVRNGGASRPIPFTDAAEHAAFLVKAANAHDALVDALEAARKRIAENIGDYGGILGKIEAALLLAKHGGAS
jgi:hypothetical protein